MSTNSRSASETARLLLVDYENKQKVDLSVLDASFRAIIFVGANQNPPKAAKKPATAHRFSRVDFLKVSGNGKNALDFHIAFELGRTFEAKPQTECFVLSGDKGFDPLLSHLITSGMQCRRIESLDDLLCKQQAPVPGVDEVKCPQCKKASTIEHHGGRWCSHCGRFAVPADPALLPSNQPGYREAHRPRSFTRLMGPDYEQARLPECGWCHQRSDMTGGIYDDGEWMCGLCVGGYADR